MAELTVVSHAMDATAVLALVGDLDRTTAHRVHTALDALVLAPGQQLVLDLAGLEFCDSRGISTMVAARNIAVAAGAGIALAGVPQRISRVLRIMGLEQIISLFPTLTTAVDAWTPTKV
ncbi:STAS domain-containing protein [Pseudonocardia sp. GCM10023141]|uniref:STAS domain-containing protein n=1 Tax=Pseudonocardia sp. GCM10023141 TaxID=3252653 RepID=UPI003624131F